MNKESHHQEKIKYIYILSQRYSGSTLLSFLLGTNPNISTIGERRKFFNKSIKSGAFPNHRAKICSCGKQFEDCDYFNTIKNQLLSKVDQNALSTNATEFKLSSNKYLNRIAYEFLTFFVLNGIPLQLYPFNRKLKELCEFNRLLVKEILTVDNSRIFLDSSKVINHVLFLSLIEEFDLHVIWLVRDPRAQVNSALKYNTSWDTKTATAYWKKEMIENKKMLQKAGVKYVSLRYEDLCKSPKEELAKIYAFAGLAPDKIDLDFRSKEQHIIGNGNMRLGKDNTIVERREWEQELSKDQLDIIESMTSAYQHLYAGTSSKVNV